MANSISLNNTQKMPLLGFGTYNLSSDTDTENSVSEALRSGYRMIDTAPYYKNEPAVSRGISRSRIPRNELYITTKVWNTAQRLGNVDGAFERSLDRLGLDYVDLFLIHWPVPGCYLSTWKLMEEVLDSGRAASIGVCNFQIHHLKELQSISGLKPAVNQIEINPYCYPKALIDYCRSEDIAVQAIAPLSDGRLLDDDVLCVMGIKYAHTPAQVGLRYLVQKDISVLPCSRNPEQISEYTRIFDFSIDPEDMDLLDTLDRDYHSIPIPEDLQGIRL